jgi:hypothetical protein
MIVGLGSYCVRDLSATRRSGFSPSSRDFSRITAHSECLPLSGQALHNFRRQSGSYHLAQGLLSTQKHRVVESMTELSPTSAPRRAPLEHVFQLVAAICGALGTAINAPLPSKLEMRARFPCEAFYRRDHPSPVRTKDAGRCL